MGADVSGTIVHVDDEVQVRKSLAADESQRGLSGPLSSGASGECCDWGIIVSGKYLWFPARASI